MSRHLLALSLAAVVIYAKVDRVKQWCNPLYAPPAAYCFEVFATELPAPHAQVRAMSKVNRIKGERILMEQKPDGPWAISGNGISEEAERILREESDVHQ